MLNEPFCRKLLADIRRSLFCPETGMIYDYRTRCGTGAGFDHLPSREEIQSGFPNPCGWGTGMEDCALNAGLALDICRMLPEADAGWAAALTGGVRALGTVHGRRGFIARGISRRAPELTYGNTSRDQLTLAVYGLWRTAHRADLDAVTRATAAATISDCARYCRKHATATGDWELARLDGGRAMVSKMWDCDCHESLRLPMIYAAAADCTGAAEMAAAAREFFAPGLDRTLRRDNRRLWWDLPTLQMQISIRMLLECGFFDTSKPALELALDAAGEYAAGEFETTLCEAEAFRGDWCAWNANWRERPMLLYGDSISGDRLSAAVDGQFYPNPAFPEAYSVPNTLLRRLGCHLATLGMSVSFRPSAEQMNRLETVLETIDFARLGGDGALKLLHGLCWLKQGGL